MFCFGSQLESVSDLHMTVVTNYWPRLLQGRQKPPMIRLLLSCLLGFLKTPSRLEFVPSLFAVTDFVFLPVCAGVGQKERRLRQS